MAKKKRKVRFVCKKCKVDFGSAHGLGAHYAAKPNHRVNKPYWRKPKAEAQSDVATINFCPCCGFAVGRLLVK